ncbi:MAG: hypothetical protein ACOC0P_02275, partial [Planctomycetota bacterium]
QLWVHGAPKTPQHIVPLNAMGGRMFVDLSRLSGTMAKDFLRAYHDQDVGICLTLRWQNPENTNAPDVAPTRAEQREKTDLLMEVLTSPESRQLAGRIWVQFFNEITGGPGMIQPEEADIMFDWATETALRIRREAPHVMICGPALTALDVLEKDKGQLSSVGQARHAGLQRAFEWSAKYAEAIDLHLHLDGGQDTRDWIRLLRDELNRYPNGELTYILSLEWSPARYPDTEDLDGAMVALKEIYREMAVARFPIAAYACFYPAYSIGEKFHWQSIAHAPDKPSDPPRPNEPFYSTLTEIGAGQIDIPGLREQTDLNPSAPPQEIWALKQGRM